MDVISKLMHNSSILSKEGRGTREGASSLVCCIASNQVIKASQDAIKS